MTLVFCNILTARRLVRAAVGGRRDVRARRQRGHGRGAARRRAVLRRAVQVLLGRLLHVPAVPACLPAGPGMTPRPRVWVCIVEQSNDCRINVNLFKT